jgi:hypothetical protein
MTTTITTTGNATTTTTNTLNVKVFQAINHFNAFIRATIHGIFKQTQQFGRYSIIKTRIRTCETSRTSKREKQVVLGRNHENHKQVIVDIEDKRERNKKNIIL